MMKAIFTPLKHLLLLVPFVLSLSANAQTYSGTVGPVPDITTTSFTVNVPLTGTIGTDYEISSLLLDITHTWDSDLDIFLIAPDGTTMLELTTDNGGDGNNYTNTVFQDGAQSITTGTPPFTGTFEPEGGPFATAFNGVSVNGTWTLEITDDSGGSTGDLNHWRLTFDTLPSPESSTYCSSKGSIPDVGTTTFTVDVPLTGTIGTNFDVNNAILDVTHTWDSDLDIFLIAPDGTTMLELTTDNGGDGDNYTNTVFQDGAQSITTGTPPFTGTFEPEGGPFATAFNGVSVNGTWTFQVADDEAGDIGYWNFGCITFDTIIATVCTDAEFFYDAAEYCQNGNAPVLNHTTGTDGTYTYVAVSGGPNLALNASTGAIDLAASDPGTYEITNTVNPGAGNGCQGIANDLIITGVLDGPLSGGTPKAIEFYVANDIPDLSLYGFGSANNGGGSDGQEFTFPAVAATAGDYIYVATETTNFTAFFGFAPDYTSTAAAINGDDAIELFFNGTVIDVFGDINTDGTGQPWEYLDGWAYRVSNTGPDGSTFVLSNWTFSGPNALDGETSNATAATPWPLGTYTCSGGGSGTACTHTETITILAAPDAFAGFSVVSCGTAAVNLNATAATGGAWSGGAGTFSDVNDAQATYTPDASEVGTTVTLYWTVPGTAPCTDAVDSVSITFLQEPDAEFAYDADTYCPNGANPVLSHTTGTDGVYSYTVVSGGPTLNLNTETGAIDLNGTDQGTYTITNEVSGCGNMVITGVIDGPLTGGIPKAVELYVLRDIPDLSVYGLGSANNGGGSDGEEFTFPSLPAFAGDFIYVATEAAAFQSFFGFSPGYITNAVSINGDDAIELFCNGQVIDVFGDIHTDGTGEPWEYRDGWAYRESGGPNGPVFEINQWFFSGPDALDGETTNAGAATPMPIGSYQPATPTGCDNASYSVTITIEDVTAPVITCPADIVVNLDPGACSAIVLFDVTATDDCDPNPVITQTDATGLGSGDDFYIGTYDLTFEAADMFGNTATCGFNVTIEEYPNPTSTLTCNDLVQVSLDADGCSTIGADMILEGGPYGCYDDYIVSIEGGDDIVCCEDIGGTLTVQVTDPDTGNSCWGNITVEDKLAPVLDCNTVTIACTEDFNNVPYPAAYDNCTADLTINIVDEYFVDTDMCDDNQTVVMRGFLAVDAYGNESEVCYQTIEIQRPEEVDFPDDVIIACAAYNSDPTLTEPSHTGYPTPNSDACMYGSTWQDEILATCGSTFKVVRTWIVVDWCTQEVLTSNSVGEDNIQVIKVVDDEAPVISMDPFTVSANVPGAHPQPCKSTDYLPAPQVSDNCHGYTISIFTPIGEAVYANGTDGAQGGFIPAPGLELGFHEILYQAVDECGNVEEIFVVIEVVDDIAPTAICDEITDVNLSSEGEAVVFAETFDDGSHDNCCLDYFEVRRMDGDCDGNYDDFGPDVTFCCSDANTQVTVVFRAYDCFGNYNDCMVLVNVQDKIPPVNTFCPADVQITCDDYLDNLAAALAAGDAGVLDQYGEATFYDNCEAVVDYVWTQDINTCTEGTISRTWVATDPSGNAASVTCVQNIEVNHVDDWYVVFPDDLIAQCVDGQLPHFGEPQIFDDACELIGVSFQDEQFDVVADACYKIIRHWSVINWCTYPDGLSFYHDQVIKVVDEEAPIFNVDDRTYCIEETDCDVNITLPTPDVTDCSSETVITVTSADLAAYDDEDGNQYTYANVPPGEYVVDYAVTDNCGNTSYDQIVVTVVDCKKPTPICVEGLVIEIMQTGMVEIWASDFNAASGSFDNCTAQGDLKLSLSADVTDISRTYTCDDLGQQPIELWVTDAAGNQDYCVTFVEIQDNMGVCPSQAFPIVAGVVATEEEVSVEGVMVDVNNGLATMTTSTDGTYHFELPAGGDYTVTPMLDSDPLNGVSTLDLVLISRHILGMDLLDSPYKMIAADANNSGTISTLDLVAIQRVILLLDETFPGNTSWRFVDKDYIFPNPQDPWQEAFPEVINYNNLSQDDLFADFVAVKIGDVNGSVQANVADNALEFHAAAGDMIVGISDRLVKAGEAFKVVFTAEQAEVSGYQFTLDFDAASLQLVEVLEGVAGEEDLGLALVEDGAITVSWATAEAVDLRDQVLFGLVFRATASGKLSEMLSIGSRYVKAEAYNAQDELLDVQMSIDGKVQSDEVVLYQNNPNPFKDETVIGFYLPEGGKVSLSILDASGRVIRLIRIDAEKGYNEVRVSGLHATGVLYYKLETAQETITRKMVVLK